MAAKKHFLKPKEKKMGKKASRYWTDLIKRYPHLTSAIDQSSQKILIDLKKVTVIFQGI